MEFPLPQIQSSLKPYIQTPSEATYIRQVVTQHLTNLSIEKRTTSGVGSRDEFRRFLDFELGRGGGGSRCIRKEYLEALREKAEARKALEAEDVESDPDEEEDEDGEGEMGGEEGNRWIGEYTSTLSLTRQFEKLEILQIYLRTFNDPAVLEAEDKHKIHFNDAPPNPPAELTAVITARSSNNSISASAGSNTGGITEDLSTGLLALEKTILGTHDSLQREAERLRELQSNGQDGGVRRRSRKEAFARTRDALITWVESQLSHTGAVDVPDTSAATLSVPTDSGDVAGGGGGGGGRSEKTSLEDIISDINASYEEYLAARREVVEVLSAVTQTLTQSTPITTTATTTIDSPPTTKTKTPPLTPPLPPPPILKVLSALEELIPLLNSQKALLSQKTFFLSSLASTQKSLLTTLEENADESFAITSSRGGSASVQLAKRIADRETVQMEKFAKEVAGLVRAAGGTLEDVNGLLGEVEGLVVRKNKKKEGEGETTRIPVRRVVKGRRRGGGVEVEEVEVEKGFWGMIAGNVGVIGDGI
ncbi:hypothetical protein L873DRAFT_1794540 [Choiromyces venosus 120613-1]|uniref:Uncharacterized protein n=1 Tax=Choiromyces venosus 120613-1 TaxID=1336337 RepID=A0A3N4J407_9PEZI|nr:hypothetical protein L873DRAFT_1794540 [Choiromyces venosus 120613-1]